MAIHGRGPRGEALDQSWLHPCAVRRLLPCGWPSGVAIMTDGEEIGPSSPRQNDPDITHGGLVWRRALVDLCCGTLGINQGAINATLSQ